MCSCSSGWPLVYATHTPRVDKSKPIWFCLVNNWTVGCAVSRQQMDIAAPRTVSQAAREPEPESQQPRELLCWTNNRKFNYISICVRTCMYAFTYINTIYTHSNAHSVCEANSNARCNRLFGVVGRGVLGVVFWRVVCVWQTSHYITPVRTISVCTYYNM